MSIERRSAAWAAVTGTVGAGLAAAFLGVRFADDGAVLLGFGFGVAVVGVVLSVGMIGVAHAADVDREPPYLYPATAGSASVLLSVATTAHSPDGDPPAVSVALVGAAVLVVVGSALVFVSEFRRSPRNDGD